jgi:hypothetical protein
LKDLGKVLTNWEEFESWEEFKEVWKNLMELGRI